MTNQERRELKNTGFAHTTGGKGRLARHLRGTHEVLKREGFDGPVYTLEAGQDQPVYRSTVLGEVVQMSWQVEGMAWPEARAFADRHGMRRV